MVWPCIEERRHGRCKASNNDEGGREETSRKAQTEVDGQSDLKTSLIQSSHTTEKHGERQSWRSTPDMDKIDKGEQMRMHTQTHATYT